MPLPKILRALFFVCGFSMMACAQSAKVIMLGSGTPIPDPASSGPCVAIVVNGRAYLFDAGAGVVRRAEAAAEKFGMAALDATNLTRLFFTHLHSDHTLGYPDMMLTGWVVGRSQPLEVYGPPGVAATALNTASGFRAAMWSSTRAGPSGTRRPCSQLRSVAGLIPSSAANRVCDNRNRARKARTSGGPVRILE